MGFYYFIKPLTYMTLSGLIFDHDSGSGMQWTCIAVANIKTAIEKMQGGADFRCASIEPSE